MKSSVATLELVKITNGVRTPIRIEVGQPYLDPDGRGGWVCPVLVPGVDKEAIDIYGANSLQALCLGLVYVRSQLESVLKDGSRLIDLREGDDFPLNACFGDLHFLDLAD
jgi:hypothetical protein